MIRCFKGVRAYIYSPKEEPSALGSNRLHIRQRCILRGSGGILQKGVEEFHRRAERHGGGASPTWQLLVLHFGPVPSGVFWSLLVHISSQLSFVLFDNSILIFILSGISLLKIIIHQNSWKL
jgi:hypothetical protein